MSRKRFVLVFVALGLVFALGLTVFLSGVGATTAASAAEFLGIWHTPPYQGFSQSQYVLAADAPGTWHTPAYQGYTPLGSGQEPSGVWHTPAYQGYTPSNGSTGEWHTPAYQGYTPARSVPPADAPGTWHTPAYQGYNAR